MTESVEEKAKQFAEQLFPLQIPAHVKAREIAVMAYKVGHAAGFTEASNRDFGSGFLDEPAIGVEGR